MNDGAMKTVESMWVDIWCMLDWIVAQHCRNAFPWHELLNQLVHRIEVGEGNEVAFWERWGLGWDSEMAWQDRCESSEVSKWEIPRFIQGLGTQGETKISSFCFLC